MKKSIVSVILAALMVAGTTGIIASASDRAITLPDDKFTAEGEEFVTTTAIGGAPSGRLPKRIVFKAESGVIANSYTGYITGVQLGASEYDIANMLENGSGISVQRETPDGTITLRGDTIEHGDKVVLVDESVATVEELTIIFMGNVDMNNSIDLSDVTAMLKSIAGWSLDVDTVAADVNGDGVVNLSDVTLMLKKIAKWDVDFVKTPTLPGQYEMVQKNETRLYKNSNVPFSPICLSDGHHYDLAVKFNVAADEFATKIIAHCPSFADNEGSFTFSVYKWMGDYDTTVAGMPIVTKDFVNFKDNDYLTFDMTDPSGKGLVEGEYMWRIHNGYDDPSKAATGVGIYYYPSLAPDESTGIKTFLNCKEFNIGPKASIIYATAK